tara:strand:+ start:1558 stop:2028 length:471 start_codon:yes stop_codon:yes gene_type:complete
MEQHIKYSFDALKAARAVQISFLKQYSFEQLTAIPKGFSNSILWNFGHIVVAQHLLSYGLSNGELQIDRELISKYKRGSTGKENVSEEDFEAFLILSNTLISNLIEDYEELKKNDFKSFMTGLNVAVNSIDDSISFNNTHEGIHLGVMLSIAKFIT